MRRKTFFFAKDRNFNSRFLRFFARNANIILLNINRDLKETLQKMAAISRSGGHLAIFPEGARTRDGKIMHFKKSFAILSRELNIPVVPVVIHGTFDIFSIGNKIPQPGDIRIEFLDPVYPGEMEYEQIVEKTYNAIVKKF
jgi:long-chain acyl-CoA synthetase